MGYVGKKVIVCGVDGAGKSTFVNNWIKDHSNEDWRVIHCTRHTPNTYEYFRSLFLSEGNIIFDRAMYGQFVYQTKEQREERDQLTLADLVRLESILSDIPYEIYYVYADLNVCLYNCKRDEEDSYYSEEYIKELDIKFRQVFDMSTLKINYYYNDYHPTTDSDEDFDYNNFDYSSLPKVVAVDFDNTLVYGKNFPEIGKLNTKLVYDLFEGKYKDWKKVLFTHRCGENLIEACNFLADNGIYFDAVNDDIPEVKERLHRNPINNRKIWFDYLIDDKAINPWDKEEYIE